MPVLACGYLTGGLGILRHILLNRAHNTCLFPWL